MDEAGVSGTNSSIAESILAGAVGPSVGPGRGTCLMNLLRNPLQKALSQQATAETCQTDEAGVSGTN